MMKMRDYTQPDQELHPKLQMILDAIPEEIQDDYTGRRRKNASYDYCTSFSPFKRASVRWEHELSWGKSTRAVEIKYSLRNSHLNPRPRRFIIHGSGDDASFNLKGVIKALREIHASIQASNEQARKLQEARKQEGQRGAALLGHLKVPQGWKIVYDDREFKYHLMRDQRRKGWGDDPDNLLWHRSDSIQIDKNHKVTGKITLNRISIERLNEILEIVAQAEAEVSE